MRSVLCIAIVTLCGSMACSDDNMVSEPARMTEQADMSRGEDASADASADASSPLDMSDASKDMPRYPAREDLPARAEPPDVFTSFDGTRTAKTLSQWEEWRRDELLDLFAYYVYGYAPDAVAVSARVTRDEPDFVPGSVHYQEIELELEGLPEPLHLSVFMPHDTGQKHGVFIALNKCGNQEVLADPRIRATRSWFDASGCGSRDVEMTRGVRASNWPVMRIVEAGYALIAVHESDIDPDDQRDREFEDGVHPHFALEGVEPRAKWGRIAAWAWGIERVVDWVMENPSFDPDKIAVVGHSRRGKTALLSGARDERIDLVIAHQSGRGGSALNRSEEGEPAWIMNSVFPHWFNDVYPSFDRHPEHLPLDQHMLVALSAPRLVLLTDGEEDAWADPKSSQQSARLASPVWALYDEQGLGGRLSWQVRPGDHSLEERDWEVFLAFAASHWD